MGAIIFDKVSKSYNQPASAAFIQALDGLSLEVENGETFGFVGLNGAGKTTAVKILLGMCRADTGHALVLSGFPARRMIAKIGFAPEVSDLPEFLTVEELLVYACVLVGVDATEALLDRAIRMLALADERKRQVALLSKGTRQRVALAAAIVHHPQLIILDEPSSGLDPLGRHMIKSVIRQLNAEGATVFFSTHILSDLPDLCQRLAVINRGRQIFVGTPAEFCSRNAGKSLEDNFEAMIAADQKTAVGADPTPVLP